MQNDACFKYRGKYVDFVRSDVDGLWSVLFDNKRVKSRLPSKSWCYEWFTSHLTMLAPDKGQAVEISSIGEAIAPCG